MFLFSFYGALLLIIPGYFVRLLTKVTPVQEGLLDVFPIFSLALFLKLYRIFWK